MASSPERYDLIVIGAGSAAREAAARAATEHGKSVAVIERERWGGQCPNVACKPTKQYVAAAELLRDMRVVASELGIEASQPSFDLARLKARKDWLVGTQETWLARFTDAGYETITGEARFVDARTVRVGERELTSDRILVATGSRTAVPPIGGLDEVPWIDHIEALELTELPESLLVLGAGPVGLELGQSFARFGSRVTIVQGGARIADRSDEDASAELTAALVEEGIEVVTSTHVTAVARDGDGLVATLTPRGGGEARTVRASLLLVASGRVPNVEALRLEEAGVEHDRRGIVVDERLRTNVPGIWAAGDVTATIQLTPVATLQAQVVVADMFGDGSRTLDYDLIPTAIFTDPEVASVGLSESEALERGFDVDTVTYAAKDLLRPYYVDAPRGLLKLVFERGSRRLLGLHAVVRGGSELVQGYAVALKLGATVDDIALGHYIFPSYGEGVHYAAETVLTAAAAERR
jgi:mercuric reductase